MNRMRLFLVFVGLLCPSILFGMKKFSNNFFKNKSHLFKHKEITNTPLFNTRQNQQKRSIFHYTEYAGLEDAFLCEDLQEKASPYRGILLVESDVLNHIYKYFPEEHPVSQLLKHKKYGLFHVLENDVLLNDLRHTQINPGCAITSELTAHIVADSVRGTLELPEVKNETVAAWKESYSKQRPGNRISNKAIENQVEVFIKAQQENKLDKEERMFPEDFGIAFMLAYLYRKGTKHDMVQYLYALAKYFPKKIDTKILGSILEKRYTSQQLKKHLEYLRQEKYARFLKDRGKSIASLKQNSEKTNSYPPVALQASYGYNSKRSRPNCCEVGIQNLCNVLLAHKGKFDLSVLPATIKPHKNFVEFYTKFFHYHTINGPQVGQAFMNLVSGHPEVQYDQGDYELYSSVENILAVMNILLQTNAQDFKQLGALLSTKKRTVSFAVIKNILELIVHDQDNSLKMELHINPGSHTRTQFYDQVQYALLNELQKYDFGTEVVRLNNSFGMYSMPFYIKEMHYLSKELLSNDLSSRIMEIYGRKLTDVNKRISALRDLCSTYAAGNNVVKSSIRELCKTIPSDDTYLMSKLFEYILGTDLLEQEQWFVEFAKTHPTSYAKAVISLMEHEESCINTVHWELFKTVLSDPQCNMRHVIYIVVGNGLLEKERKLLDVVKAYPHMLITRLILKIDSRNPFINEFDRELLDETLYVYLDHHKHIAMSPHEIFNSHYARHPIHMNKNNVYELARAGGQLHENLYLFNDKAIGKVVLDIYDILGYLNSFFSNDRKKAQSLLEKLGNYFSENQNYHIFLEVLFYKLLYYHKYIPTEHDWSRKLVTKHQDLYERVLQELKRHSRTNEIVVQTEQSYKIFLEDNKI